jgi:hypothetical protein
MSDIFDKITDAMVIVICCVSAIFIGTVLYVIFNTHQLAKEYSNNYLFEIVDIKTTQVIQVTFQNITTTEMHTINFVKQYCTNWKAIELGSEWSLPVVSNETGKHILNAHLICGSKNEN